MCVFIKFQKYLPNELRKLVLANFNNNSIDLYMLGENEIGLLDEILFSNIVLKLCHYNLISKILNVSLDELLLDIDIQFKNKDIIDCKEVERLNTILNFFVEVNFLKRLAI